MSTFKARPNKLKYRSDTTTLDEIHKDLMKKLDSNYKKLEYLSQAGDLIVDYYEKLSGHQYDQNSEKVEYVDINNINTENKSISNSFCSKETSSIKKSKKNNNENENENENENNSDSDSDSNIASDSDEKVDLLVSSSNDLKLLNLLSRQSRKAKKPIKKRKIITSDPGCKSIFQFLAQPEEEEKKDNNENNESVNTREEILARLNRAELQEKFLFIIDKNYACGKVKTQKSVICSRCNIEKILFTTEGCYICKKCGETEHIVMENENNNNKESAFEKQKYPYKKINHLKEKLNQFQSKETADVPDEIYDMIINDLKKKRLRQDLVSPADIKAILKKNRQTNYYEHLQQIYCKITGSPPITLSRETETTIINMFQAMQEPFQKHRPDERSNFLSYAYVLNKLFRIIGLEQHSKFFYLLKSKEKLRDQDNIWAKICKDMNWRFFSSF
jgi:hypothetical protein